MISWPDLPSGMQFALTVVGGWLAGVASAVFAFWRWSIRLVSRVQALEQTIYGKRGEPGLVHKVNGVNETLEEIKRLLVKLCQKAGIEDGL